MLPETGFGECAAASRLCRELTKKGGIHSSFASFLRWRADILPRGWIHAFEQARETAPTSKTEAAQLLRQDLGARGDELAAHLEAEPCWSTRARWAYRSQCEGRAVVVEAAREPVSRMEYHDFERSVSRLPDAPPSAVSSPVLNQFREWLSLAHDLSRERAYIEAAGEFRKHTSFLVPEIVPGLCSARVLCFTWIEGTPASSRIRPGDSTLVGQLAEMVLEQASMLGMIDADLDLETVVIADGGRLAVRRWNRFVPVPLGLRLTMLKYLCAALCGESERAAQMLVRLALGHDSKTAVESLRRELASVEPELKGRLQFPGSATVLESHWKAVSSISPNPPLYLACLHRNLHAVGYWCAEAGQQATGGDPITEAKFAVLGRMVRRRTEDVKNESASGWAWGFAMLPWKALRQAIRLAEAFGENEPASVSKRSRHMEDGFAENREIRSLISAGLLLAVFLVCVHLGKAASAPWSAWLVGVALTAFAGLAGVVVRLD